MKIREVLISETATAGSTSAGNIANAGGETDLEVTFDVEVK